MTQYNLSYAKEMMTLCSLAETRGGEPAGAIRQELIRELQKPDYATGGKWELCYGPAVVCDNMVYAVRRTDDPASIAVVIRGTLFNWHNIEEDALVDPVPYPHEPAGLRISHGMALGLRNIEKMVGMAAVPGSPTPALMGLAEWLGTLGRVSVTVTGHSLGGALATLAGLWLADTLEDPIEWSIYAFAGPTVGDPAFAAYFDDRLGSCCYRVVNHLDLVPRAYASLESIVDDSVPCPVPSGHLFDPANLIRATALFMKLRGWNYRQVGSQVDLPRCQIPYEEPVTVEEWASQIPEQHHPNAYLHLLGAPQTDVGDPSTLPCP